ncbi:hypothetical protein SAMN05920897_11121 [Alkalispirochaeta americana]|uniref:Uncharacterized protein n=1 Tax=Alkalispirochaeta americana TaxID=159291 RepID=A0A1N6TWM6_9SPIO|nr:hypothetical protein [Alkalispirochaeta americana]SIQ57677.1 hypothetical protein SAMN05920897_11121 [Alkalispirochaeta americana]
MKVPSGGSPQWQCLLILAGFFLAGCSDFLERGVLLQLPDLPAHYESGEVLWRISWWDGRRVRKKEVAVSSGNRSSRLVLPLSKGGALLPVVTVTPVLGPGQGVELAPFGGWLLPGDARVLPDRHCGEISLVLLGLAREGLDPALVNVERLEGLVRERLPRYPRRLDRVRLAAALAEQRMHSHHVAKRWAPMYQIRLPWESPETEWAARPWITDDPAEPPLVPAPAGVYELFSLGVLPGEVRHLWRAGSTEGRGTELLVVHRTPEGHGFHRLVELSPGGERARKGP